MTVTKIEPITKTKYKVYLDEQFAFVLYKGELSRYQVKEKRELSEEDYQEIRNKIILKRAKLRALHLLNTMGRTETQLREKLRQGGYPVDIIEETVTYVKSFGYVDDLEYARNFILNRKHKKSRKELCIALCRKGIDQGKIEEVFEECYGENDPKVAIETIFRKKNYHPDTADEIEKKKMLAYLINKGFRYEDVRQLIQVSKWNA